MKYDFWSVMVLMVFNAILYGVLGLAAVALVKFMFFLYEMVVKDFDLIGLFLIIAIIPIALLAVIAYLLLHRGVIPMIFRGDK